MPTRYGIKKGGTRKQKGGDSSNTILIVGMLLMFLVVYYYMYISNQKSESFTNPQLSETDLKPAKNEVVLGLFYADWCPHCRDFKPEWKKAQDELNGTKVGSGLKAKLVSVDCEANPDLAKKYEIQGYPTIKVIKADGTVEEFTDDRSLSGIKNYLHNL